MAAGRYVLTIQVVACLPLHRRASRAGRLAVRARSDWFVEVLEASARRRYYAGAHVERVRLRASDRCVGVHRHRVRPGAMKKLWETVPASHTGGTYNIRRRKESEHQASQPRPLGDAATSLRDYPAPVR
jgi:hypothetical protein